MKIIGYPPADIVQDCQRISRILAHLQVVSRVMRRRQKMRHSCQSIQKAPPKRMELFKCWHYLSSRAVARQVLSAQMSLTSVFGMGTGVPSPQSTPTIYLSSGFCPRTFIIIPPLDSLVKRFFGDPSGIRTHVNGVRGRCLNHLTMGPWCTFTDSNRGPTD